ncbi:MAG: hypothetical protein R3275_09130 [Saprospiraceae bacterium]|nr:hypothetical protein [Saprospiraceae bacterium]
MPNRQFYLGLATTTVLTLLALAGLYYILPRGFDLNFIMPLLIVFIILTIVMFVIGKKAAYDKNPYRFGRVFLIFTFGKILFSVLMIVIYEQINQSGHRYYLLSFLVVYLSFTIYETVIFMRLSKSPEE